MKHVYLRWAMLAAVALLSQEKATSQEPLAIQFDGLDNGAALEIVGTYLYSPMSRRKFADYATGRVLRRVIEIAGVCNLDPATRKRLDQAAKADVDRLKGRIRNIELEYRGTPLDNSPKSRAGISAIQQLKQDLETDSPLSNSLVRRMIPRILNAEQRTQLADYDRAKAMRRIDAACRVVISSVERSMPMIGDQRSQLLDLMLAHDFPEEFTSQQELALAYSAFVAVSDAELEAVFDNAQLKVIKQYRARWAGLAAVVE
ncbi:MAG: hypothetical protein Aurels2KO_33360 [Aureliella sp.]